MPESMTIDANPPWSKFVPVIRNIRKIPMNDAGMSEIMATGCLRDSKRTAQIRYMMAVTMSRSPHCFPAVFAHSYSGDEALNPMGSV